jgi:hypothetical protein
MPGIMMPSPNLPDAGQEPNIDIFLVTVNGQVAKIGSVYWPPALLPIKDRQYEKAFDDALAGKPTSSDVAGVISIMRPGDKIQLVYTDTRTGTQSVYDEWTYPPRSGGGGVNTPAISPAVSTPPTIQQIYPATPPKTTINDGQPGADLTGRQQDAANAAAAKGLTDQQKIGIGVGIVVAAIAGYFLTRKKRR